MLKFDSFQTSQSSASLCLRSASDALDHEKFLGAHFRRRKHGSSLIIVAMSLTTVIHRGSKSSFCPELGLKEAPGT